MAYGLRAYWQRENRFGVTDRIEILEDGYSGTAVEFGAKKDPFKFNHREITQESSEGLLNIHANKILEGVLDFYPLVDTTAKGMIIDDIANSALKQFKVALKRDGDVMWYGYPSGRKVSRPERETYFSSLRFLDVEFLKGQTFPKEDNRQTLITTIADLLGYLDFGISITTVTSWQEENTTVTDDFLNQVYSDTYGLRDYQNDTPLTVYNALKRVCEPVLLVKQWDGWRVNQISGYADPENVLEYVYNASGVQQSSANTDKRQTLYTSESSGTPSVKIASNRNSYPAIKKSVYRFDDRSAEEELGVFQTANTLEATELSGLVSITEGAVVLVGASTSFLSDINEDDEIWCYNGDYLELLGEVEEVSSNTNLTLKNGAAFSVSSGAYATNATQNQTSSVNFESNGNQSLSYRFIVDVKSSGNLGAVDYALPYKIKVGSYYYNASTDSWTTTKTINRDVFTGNGGTEQTVTVAETVTAQIPASQSGLDLTVYVCRRESDDLLIDESFWNINRFDSNNVTASTGTVFEYTAEQSPNYYEIYNYGTLLYGDAVGGASLDTAPAYYRYGTADSNFTSGWRRRGETPYNNYDRVLLREFMDFQRTRTRKISLEVWGEYDPNKISVYEGFNLMHVGGGYDGRWSPITIDVNEQVETDSYSNTIVSTADVESTGGGTASSGGTTSGISQSDADSRYFRQSELLSESSNDSALRANIGLDIGSDVQAWDNELDTLSGLTSGNASAILGISSTQWSTLGDITATGAELNRLDGTLPTVRTNLGLGSGDDVKLNSLTVSNYLRTGASLGNDNELIPFQFYDFSDEFARITAYREFSTDGNLRFYLRDDSTLKLRSELSSRGLFTQRTDSANGGILLRTDSPFGNDSLLPQIGFNDTSTRYATIQAYRQFSNQGYLSFSVLRGGAVGEVLRLDSGVNSLANIQIGGIEVIDSSRNFFGANADFTGSLDVDGNATLNANLDVLGLATVDSLNVVNDGTIGRNLYVEGGLFATEFVINQKRVRYDEVMSVGGGKISTVTGPAGSEVITFEDEEGNAFAPVDENDILRVQRTTGFSGGVIVKSIYRRVSSITGNNITLTTSGINWTTGNDVGSLEVADSVIIHGNTTDGQRDHRIEFDVSGVDIPRVQVWDGVDDIDTGNNVLQWGGLEGWGSQTGIGFAAGDSSLSGNHILLSNNVASLRFPQFSIINGNATFRGAVDVGDGSVLIDDSTSFDINNKVSQVITYFDQGRTTLNEFDLSEVLFEDITSLVSDDLVKIGGINSITNFDITFFIAAREELSFTQDPIINLEVQGYDGSSWEAITGRFTYAYPTITYDDYGGSNLQDPFSQSYEFNFSDAISQGAAGEPIIFSPNAKYTQYRLRIENGSFDDNYGLQIIKGRDILQQTQINSEVHLSRDIFLSNQLRIYSHSDNGYFQYIARREDNSTNKIINLYRQAFIDGQFVGESLIDTYSTSI